LKAPTVVSIEIILGVLLASAAPEAGPPVAAEPAVGAGPSVAWNFTFPGHDASDSSRLDEVLALARAARRPVMIDFSAEWCAACRLLDRNTLTAPEVIRQASRFLTIRIDVSNLDDATDLLAKRFGVHELPTVAFVSSQGTVLGPSNIRGLVDASTLAHRLRTIP
jgi:thiol:disulfide interchange protein DsbD